MEENETTIPGILKKFADIMGTQIKNRKLEIPAQFGNGYCMGYIFNKNIRMLISNYELNDELIIENPDLDEAKRMIFFKFQNIFPKMPSVGKAPSVLIGTSRINTDEMISIHSNTATINIEVDADYLNGLFYSSEKSPVLQNLLQNNRPFLFEQILYPSLQDIVNEILSEPVEEIFILFFLKIKAEELICRLLMELEKRDEKQLYALNIQDVKIIYIIKEQILEHLDTPPSIKELAIKAGMSPTKLKRLFKQIFGDSIFSYYQEFRIKEAAFLLKEGKYSVSEVGYRLGFTNLSHFSKVFQDHIGVKPKQYSML
ncbi:helix-turn-helix transcriptional regulator [Chryseobacterium sp. Tr-659]|uniref:helix-turn-helix domain-containing protein n=1 Tax=Chryseobacterium sp. Tr-659 TaxID=2608340 RepID=UPI0014244510|nr:AraC family transcriptional regulator [Chryseobacterium sp. Tr-659]NIF06116.1 helix-turn-helix transcriptional regulator [Chryseobacterium sp. Tr-659]